MKKNYTTLFLFSILLLSITTSTFAQITLYSNGFEGSDEDTYNLTTATGSDVNFGYLLGNPNDYILRGNPVANSELAIQPTGYTGTNVIMWEDFDGYLADGGQLYLTTNAINITGAMGISIRLKVGVTNNIAINRYETEDFIVIEYQIDGGSWVKVGDFRGEFTGSYLNFYEDDDLNGTFTAQITNAMKQVNYNLDNRAGTTVSGTTMKVRLRAFSGVQEEMVIDDLVVETSAVLGTDDYKLSNAIEIYPNPSSDFIQLKNSVEEKKYTIYNELGMEAMTGTNLDNRINIQNLSPGIYFLKFENTNAIKFVKK